MAHPGRDAEDLTVLLRIPYAGLPRRVLLQHPAGWFDYIAPKPLLGGLTARSLPVAVPGAKIAAPPFDDDFTPDPIPHEVTLAPRLDLLVGVHGQDDDCVRFAERTGFDLLLRGLLAPPSVWPLQSVSWDPPPSLGVAGSFARVVGVFLDALTPGRAEFDAATEAAGGGAFRTPAGGLSNLRPDDEVGAAFAVVDDAERRYREAAEGETGTSWAQVFSKRFLVAHGVGGQLALAMLRARPGYFDGAALVGTSARATLLNGHFPSTTFELKPGETQPTPLLWIVGSKDDRFGAVLPLDTTTSADQVQYALKTALEFPNSYHRFNANVQDSMVLWGATAFPAIVPDVRLDVPGTGTLVLFESAELGRAWPDPVDPADGGPTEGPLAAIWDQFQAWTGR